MLENIAWIASIISALTAVTTALRALGKSREPMRGERRPRGKTGFRAGEFDTGNTGKSSVKRNALLPYLIVTLIWFFLAAAFAVPLIIERWTSNNDTSLLLWLSPFLLLALVILFIWWIIMHPKH